MSVNIVLTFLKRHTTIMYSNLFFLLFQWKYEDSFDKNGFDKNGFDKNGFDKNGFDKNGFDIDGFDKDCFHENGFNILGYDKNGFDINGYDKDGVHKDGFDESNYPDYPDLNSDWDTNDYNNKNDYSSADRYIRFSLSKWDKYFRLLVFGILVTLVAGFSFCFIRLANLALQNVNNDYVMFSYFCNFVAKSDH